jgi:hypothetical protein
MQANDPWAAFNPQPAGNVAPGSPAVRPLTQPAPKKDKPDRMTVDGTVVEFGEDGKPKPVYAAPKTLTADQRDKLIAQRNSLSLFKRRVGDIEKMYERDFKGFRWREVPSGIGVGDITLDKALPKSWQPKAAAFDAAGGTLMGELKAAMGMTGSEANSAAEVEIRFGPYIPKASDSDEEIETKVAMLKQLLDNEERGVSTRLGEPNMNGSALGPGRRLPPEKEQELLALVNSGASPEEIDAFLKPFNLAAPEAHKAPNATALDYSKIDAAAKAEIDARMAEHGGAGAAGVMGAVDAATLGFGDELSAGVRALGGSLQGEGSFGDLYGQNVAVERGYRDQLGEQHGGAYLGGQLLGGLAIPFGSGATGIRGLGAVGAAQGGAYGFGSGEGNPLERLPGAALGAGVGGTAGAALGFAQPYATNALTKFANRPSMAARQAERAEALPIIEAGQRQNIPIRQPDARPGKRADFAAVEASETGNPIVRRAMQQDEAAVQGRVSEVGGPGKALDDFELGQRVQKAGEGFLARTGKQADALYERARTKAGGASGSADEAIASIDGHIAELRSTGEKTNAEAIKYLEDLKSDLAGGASIDRLRNIRKNIRGQISSRNLTATDTERRVGDVMTALGRDVERILPPDAAAAFKGADKFYRERMEFKDQVIRRFVGRKDDPISPEMAAQRFNSFMRSKDFGRFSRMMKELAPEDRTDIAATVAEGLGKARNGEFSLAALSTNIDRFSPRALREVFGEDGAKAIADLKIIARAKADAAGALNNSRTGAVASRNGLKDIVLGLFGYGVGGIPGAIGGAVLRRVSEKIGSTRQARLLLNPDFTKWLRQTPPSANPKVINAHFARLSKVAANDAVFAADVKALQSTLAEQFTKSAAASEADERGDDDK